MSFESLTFLAGPTALARIRQEGLRPEMVSAVSGAAGGPKWLVLSGLDKCFFPVWLAERRQPLLLLGSSSGAWRLACAAMNQPVEAISRFQEAYTQQSYLARPSPQEISRQTQHIITHFLGEQGVQEILQHPYLRLHILAVRSKGLNTYEQKGPLALGLVGAALANLISRRALGLFFERVLFYDPRQEPLLDIRGFPLQTCPLQETNLSNVLLASGSIPWLMAGVKNIPGAAPGIYRDGGVIDYHIDIALPGEGLVLYPHYTDVMASGWLDKELPWRKPQYMDKVLLVIPSPAFIESLPLKKIPDRNDFYLFAGKDQERIEYWNIVAAASQQLGQEFLEVVDSGKIRERVQPMFG